MDYRFETLDLADDSDRARARRSAWLQAVMHGFHEGRVEDEFEKLWVRDSLADDATCVGAWLPEGAFGAGDMPVATTSWFDKALNAGRDLVPLRMITDVTTSPAHRRRGLVRRMIEDCLDDAVAAGVPLAALTVSEATIYGRWGFGAATFAQHVELDTGPRFGLREVADPGRVELIDPRESWAVISPLLERFHRRTRGSVGTPAFYETHFTGGWSFPDGGPDKKLRGAVHLSADETVDGVVLFRPDGRDDAGHRKLKLQLLLAEDATVTLALWGFLGGIDLVRSVSWFAAAPDDPLRWALRDINALKLTENAEFLWVRVLDVPAALAARPWSGDDTLVLEVDDAQGHAAGRWQVTTRDGVAEVTPTDTDADLRLDAETLGSLYLAGVGIGTLHAAGRIRGERSAADRFAAMADLALPPYNILGF
ncbi:GNAT family N-acetyltransferase [Nocardioides coralli]|uniref:GNAT family N-acetyltransferase n=1 Tax=Nocardioides coralli TaxID=2872154 RepID=UPI001CA435D1|nr:GNAT family N-acetyltransferase [Nocardioides coralli]QZY29466.1 GNAT family N-acetyltransferase [Nocardioides coralli]